MALRPPYTIGDQSVYLTPRQIGGYTGAPAEVIGSGSIASRDFTSGDATGWIIRGDGSFELAGGTFRGDITSDNWDGSFPGLSATAGWGLDYDTGNAEFAGTLQASELQTGPSGDVRVFLSDGSAVGGSGAGIWFDTGDSDQDVGGNIQGGVGNPAAANEYHSLIIYGFEAYNQAYEPPYVVLNTETADGTGKQQIQIGVDSGGSTEAGITLQDGVGGYYRGLQFAAADTYILLSTKADVWNFDWFRVNTGTDFIADDGVYTGGAYYYGTTPGSDNDYIAFNEATNVFYFVADGANGYVAADRYYFGSYNSNDYIAYNDTDDSYDFLFDGTERFNIDYTSGSVTLTAVSQELRLVGSTGAIRLYEGATQLWRTDNDSGLSRIIHASSVGFAHAEEGGGTMDFRLVGLPTSAAAADMYVTAAGGIGESTSSAAVKKAKRTLDLFDFGDLMEWDPIEFEYDATMVDLASQEGWKSLGFTAEQAAAIHPDFAIWGPSRDPSNYRQVYLTPAGKEVRRRVETPVPDTWTWKRREIVDETPQPRSLNKWAFLAGLVKHVQALTLEVEDLKRAAGRPVLRDLASRP